MRLKSILERLASAGAWTQELGLAVLALAAGFGIMPILIFLAGSSALGRYDGASVARIYDSLYQGLRFGSGASWIVVLGPYGLYLTFKALRLWWRASAGLT
ncbi:MAG TPA: hypothetical protein VNR70_04235 [Steroidobacteraceae bacterium]|nr:hypothetical protein [Steroidobacteraceae bacterium]